MRLNALAAYYEQSNGFEAQWWAVGATYNSLPLIHRFHAMTVRFAEITRSYRLI
ncbi:hypothetical protein OK016_29080 [Vibrio chagasii]|nr:hypothetical protein [Vibrio chagasii]